MFCSIDDTKQIGQLLEGFSQNDSEFNWNTVFPIILDN